MAVENAENRFKLLQKYGVPEDVISVLTGDESSADQPAIDMAVSQLTKILTNAIINAEIGIDDIKDISALVPDRFSVSRAEYGEVLLIRRTLGM